MLWKFHAYIIDKLDEMNKFLGSHKQPMLIQKIRKLNCNFKPSKKPWKTSGKNGLNDEFYQKFREEIITVLHKLLRK